MNMQHKILIFSVLLLGTTLFAGATNTEAATLQLSPPTGIYTVGTSFTARIVVNTQGQPINAAEGEISFDPSDLSVSSISKAGSIFTLWTREPEFSNASGKIYFGGGSPGGYTGAAGTVMTVTFITKHAGTSNVTYAVGSILAADGKGTNVVSGMQGGSYTMQAASAVPTPEYVPPPNTPGAPQVTSKTHPDQETWYREKQAELTWKVGDDIVALRTLLDTKPNTVPTKVYDTPMRTVSLDLDEGTSYFHIQFKNKDGWGRVTSFRLNVDTSKPDSFDITSADGNDSAHPEQRLKFTVVDRGSGIAYYMVQLDGAERIKFEDKDKTGVYTTPALTPGAHSVVVEAFDYSGNSIIASFSFTIEAFDAPVFTEYPANFSSTVIPVLRGSTRPDAVVTVRVRQVGTEPVQYEVRADANGVFTFIPESRFAEGVYDISAIARDASGGQSLESNHIRIAVQEPGVLRFGNLVVKVLSVLMPLIALSIFLIAMVWFAWHRFGVLRRRVRAEANEAEQSLVREFAGILSALQENVENLRSARKGRLTKQESVLVSTLIENLASAEKRVQKEIVDIERIAE